MNADAYKYIRFNSSQETRWATVEEIQASSSYINLEDDEYPAAGLPLISDGKEAYVDNSDTHSLIFGATGSKKTRLFCMPMINMFAKAGESFIVTDPKGELYAQSSGLAKAKGYKIVVLNFRDIGVGDMWNPLSIPYELWKEGRRDEAGMLLSDVAATIAEPISSNTKDSFWTEAALELAIGGFYTLMEAGKPEEINMKSFAHLTSFGNVENLKDLTKMLDENSVAYLNYKSTVGIEAQGTVSSIVTTLAGMLRMFVVNDKLAKMLSKTTFNMRNIGREKTAVYIIVPDEKTTYHFLATMFVKQAYEILIGEAQREKNRTLPVRVNFVLDEFCNIPKIPDIPAMISAARSRNMRYYLVVQSLHQLRGRYGEDADTIKGNCDNWVFLTTKERDLLNEISELCGSIVTPDKQVRRLISPSELQRFNKERGEALIMHTRQYPIISEMADISMYKMFGTYEPVPMMNQSLDGEVKCFTLSRLLDDISNLRAVAPFASEEHLLKQAQAIYKDELNKAGYKGDISEVKPSVAAAELLRKYSKESKRDPMQGAASALEIGRANTKARLTKLIGEEYAERFFRDKLYNAKPKSFSPFW